MKLCPKCGTQYPDDANFCPGDAARLIDDERSSATSEVAEAQSAAGARVLGGRFEVGERIGGGQTGEVYRATDRKQKQPCAVKLVDASVFPSSLLLQRTERELGKLARLETEGIARIYGHGKAGDTLWIASELVPACQSLHDIVFDDGAWPVERAAAMVVKVGKALTEAARMGVIHRDLAPKNILVTADGGIKIINFGVAVPATLRVHGVPEFVAPEIIEGKPVDQRANIYSLGALFYYLITGRPPYMGEPEEVHAQHLKGSPEPPSAHAEGISDAVDVLILRALERSSSKRFMTLRQLLNDVERIAQGEEPVSAASSLARMSRSKKNPKLAQTMIGGFRVVNGTPVAETGKPGQALVAQGEGGVAAAEPQQGAGRAASQGDGAAPQEPLAAVSGSIDSGAAEARGEAGDGDGRPALREDTVQGEAREQAQEEPGQQAAQAQEPVAAGGAQAAPAGDAPGADGAVSTAEPSAAQADGAARPEDEAGRGAPGETSGEPASADQEAAQPAKAPAGQQPKTLPRKPAAKPGEQALPVQERYQDDGIAARKGEESLAGSKGGADAVSRGVHLPAAAASERVAEKVVDRELAQEAKGGRAKLMAAIVIGILLIGSIIAFAISGQEEPSGGGAGQDQESQQPAER